MASVRHLTCLFFIRKRNRLWELVENRSVVFQGAVGAFWASTAPGVPSMFDSLEVRVLCPGLVRQRASEAQGRLPRGAV
jgi:hypothetical protein